MKYRQISALLLALALLLSGCSPAAGEGEPSPDEPEPAVTDTAPAEAPEEPKETPEEPEELSPWMEDWNLFWKTLEENYPYEGVVYRMTRRSLSGLERSYRSTAQRAESAEDLLRVLQMVSKCFRYTGHMMVFDADTYAYRYGSALLGAEDNAFLQYQAELLGSEQSKSVYHWSEEEEKASASGMSSSGSGRTAASDNLTFAYYPEQSAAYVEVRSMLSSREEHYYHDQELLLDFFQTIEAEGYENCIIDIRRNGGGSDLYGKLLLLVPNLTKAIGKTHNALIKGGAETLNYYNARKLDSMNYIPELHPIEELDLDKLPVLEQEDLEGITYYASMYVGTSEGMSYPDTPAFSGKFWLLVSPRVYSASEYFTVLCKDTGFATLVGQTTGGDGIGVAPMVCVLPNSGIVYQFSTENGLNLDGGSNEEMGTQPDIVVPENEDALEVCLRAIEGGR